LLARGLEAKTNPDDSGQINTPAKIQNNVNEKDNTKDAVVLLQLATQPASLQLSSGTVTLAECLDVARLKYRPLELAKEEISVAKTKLREATRNLLPALMAKAEQTEGKRLKIKMV